MAVLRRILLAVLLPWLLAATAGRAEPTKLEPPRPGLFETTERRSDRLTLFPKWTGMLARRADEERLAAGACTETTFNRCHYRAWRTFVASLKGVPPARQIEAVNAYFNNVPYLTDISNYGISDYWATPLQFARRDGDCEDYAIAKFMTLRLLGFANDAMRVYVVQDLNLAVAHAILVVTHGGRALVLDNQIKPVIEASRVHHYRPAYSINETHWWLHRSPMS